MIVLKLPRYIKIARAVIKAVRTGDTGFIEKYLSDAPQDVRERIRNMVEAYNAYRAGKTSRDEVVRVVASSLGISNDDVDDLIDILNELIDELDRTKVN